MALFLQSIQPIVPEPGSFKAKRSSPSTPSPEQQHKGIPSAFVDEIETLRTRVEELSDEVSSVSCLRVEESTREKANEHTIWVRAESETEGRAFDSDSGGEHFSSFALQCFDELFGESFPSRPCSLLER